MNPREGVLTALNHQEPDMVPIDCGGTQVSSLTLVANDRLKAYLHVHQSGEFITCPLTNQSNRSKKSSAFLKQDSER